MKKTIHQYFCIGCTDHAEKIEKGVPVDWAEINSRGIAHLSIRKQYLLCPKCAVAFPDLRELLNGHFVPRGERVYVPYQEILITSCDGVGCSEKTEVVVGPPDQIKIGARGFPWTTCTGGGPTMFGERHYCLECFSVINPTQKPILKGGPFTKDPFQLQIQIDRN